MIGSGPHHSAYLPLHQEQSEVILPAPRWGSYGPGVGLRICIFTNSPEICHLLQWGHQTCKRPDLRVRWELGAAMDSSSDLAGGGHLWIRGSLMGKPGRVVRQPRGQGPAQNLPSGFWEGMHRGQAALVAGHKGLGKVEGQWPGGRASWGSGI